MKMPSSRNDKSVTIQVETSGLKFCNILQDVFALDLCGVSVVFAKDLYLALFFRIYVESQFPPTAVNEAIEECLAEMDHYLR